MGFNTYDYLICEQGAGGFKFNRRSNRFLASSLIGYLHIGVAPGEREEDSDTPSIDLGKCSPF